MRLFIIFALSHLSAISVLADSRVSLPNNYSDSYVEYLSLDRTQNPDQFIRLFANDIAMRGVDASGELENGAVLVAEVYSVKKDTEGDVKTSTLGRRLKDQLLLIAVMEKREEFGKTPLSTLVTGKWDFAAYKANGDVAPKNLDECRACHLPLTNSDFVFSLGHLPQAANN